jgi:phage gpG-like protein
MANEQQVFNRIKARLQAAVKSLPTIIGNEAVNFSLDRFKQSNWIDNTTEPWAPRKKETKKSLGKAILINRARLRNSIRIIKKTDNMVSIGTDVPYARIHNYGGIIQRHARSETFQRNRFKRGSSKGRFKKGTTAGKGFTFKAGTARMPRRQFLGRSQFLIIRLTRVGKAQLLKAMK